LAEQRARLALARLELSLETRWAQELAQALALLAQPELALP
jgi:hypothetical protein